MSVDTTSDEEPGAEADSEEPDLEEHERRDAGTGPTPPEARVIHEIIREDGERELGRSVSALAWSAVGAGLSMGFSFLTMALLRGGLPETQWTHLISSLGYTIGFLIVVLGRQQLFTENTLTAVLPLLIRMDSKTLVQLLRLWTIVLIFNIVGTFVFAWLISHQALFDPQINKALTSIAEEAVKDSFWPMLIKAMLAGWLIALMVWLIPGAGPSRLFLILIITYVVALGHFSHSVAGSVEAAYHLFRGGFGLDGYLTHFLIPTVIGNTIGGVSLVAILNHVPLRDELPGG